MFGLDLYRVVAAARGFIATLERHAGHYEAPGNNVALSFANVLIAAQELLLALEGRRFWDPPKPVDDAPVRIFFGTESVEAARLCDIIRECLRQSLRRIGYPVLKQTGDDPFKDAPYGLLPSMESLEDLPQVGLPELEHLIDATDELEGLANRIASPSVRPADPAPPPAAAEPAEPAAAEGTPLERTLHILKGSSKAKNLVKHLYGQTAWKASLRQVTRHLYSQGREPTADQNDNAKQLIRRKAVALAERQAPLRIE
jgi:hypothetical protein